MNPSTNCPQKGLLLNRQQNCRKVQTTSIADYKVNVAEKLKFDSQTVENIVGKGGNTGYHHFFPFPHNVFKRQLI